MFLMIDNYDSFTYNIVHYIEGMDYDITVRTPDELTVKAIEQMAPSAIIISPGPGSPEEATLALDVINTFKGRIPILGICLGFQVMVTAFGGKVEQGEPVHGQQCEITHDGKGLFAGLKQPIRVGRYHSLRAVEIPDELIVTATCNDIIMAVRHRHYKMEAVQYHPESILTAYGHEQLNNFLKECV